MHCSARELDQVVCSRFKVEDPVSYPLNNLKTFSLDRRVMISKYMERCCAKPLVLSLENLTSDVSRLYFDTNKSDYLKRLGPITAILKTHFCMTEPYAFVLAHLLLFSYVFFRTVSNVDNLSQSEQDQVTNATYICARYMHDDFTNFAFDLLQFNLYTNIFPPALVHFLSHYMTILNKVHFGILPKW